MPKTVRKRVERDEKFSSSLFLCWLGRINISFRISNFGKFPHTHTHTRTEDVKSPHTYIKIIFFAHMLDMIKIPGCALIAPRSTWSISINLSIPCINCWRNTLRIIDISWRHTQKMVKRMGKIVTKTIVLLQSAAHITNKYMNRRKLRPKYQTYLNALRNQIYLSIWSIFLYISS